MNGNDTGRVLLAREKGGFAWKDWTIVYLLAGLVALLSLTTSTFLTSRNMISILYNVSFNFFASIGFTLLIIMGELDMSVGSLYGFGGAMMGMFIFRFKFDTAPAIISAVLLAGGIGYITGILVTRFRVNSMMVTIGMMMAVKGCNWIMVNKFAGKQFAMSYYAFIKYTVVGKLYWTIVAMLAAAVALEILLCRHWRLKQLYAIGDNSDTAKLYGLGADRVKCLCFAASAAFSAFGGALVTLRTKHPDTTIGSGLEVTIITAAVVSGSSIFGGRGSVLWTMLGLIFIFALQSGMTAYNINSYVQQMIMGAILICAIYLDLRLNGRQN